MLNVHDQYADVTITMSDKTFEKLIGECDKNRIIGEVMTQVMNGNIKSHGNQLKFTPFVQLIPRLTQIIIQINSQLLAGNNQMLSSFTSV